MLFTPIRMSIANIPTNFYEWVRIRTLYKRNQKLTYAHKKKKLSSKRRKKQDAKRKKRAKVFVLLPSIMPYLFTVLSKKIKIKIV